MEMSDYFPYMAALLPRLISSETYCKGSFVEPSSSLDFRKGVRKIFPITAWNGIAIHLKFQTGVV
jgi:hypothetical protein